MRYDFATRSDDKLTEAKAEIEARAHRDGNTIVRWRSFKTDAWPALQANPFTKGVPHWIVQGFTSQSEADADPTGLP